MPAILHYLFFFVILFLFLFLFLSACSCSVMVMVVLWFSPSGCYCFNDATVHSEGPLYTAYREKFLPFYPLTTFV